jgi:hypothetical protein
MRGSTSTRDAASDILPPVVSFLRRSFLDKIPLPAQTVPLCAIVGACCTMLGLGTGCATRGNNVRHVIHISVDGLRPDAITLLGASNLPNFYRMRSEGAFTDNARTDFDCTVTLPNHTSQLTSRPVLGEDGHGWTSNGDPPEDATLASNKSNYVAGVFDVAHDHGLRTGHYASKSKFILFDRSWNEVHGAPDTVPPDHGRDKIDVYVKESDTGLLVSALTAEMGRQPFAYVFLHLRDPDSVGHASGWDPTPGTPYSDSVKAMDRLLGNLFALVDSNDSLKGHTAMILTVDHGGTGKGHGDATVVEHYTVPFYVWGPGVKPGADLYRLNASNRKNPGSARPAYAAAPPPIRNGDAANLALKLLGLPPIPGSTIGAEQDLRLSQR